MNSKNNPILMEGVITHVTDGGVSIDLSGRLGRLDIPLRMLLSQQPPQAGQKVRFRMSFVEQIEEES